MNIWKNRLLRILKSRSVSILFYPRLKWPETSSWKRFPFPEVKSYQPFIQFEKYVSPYHKKDQIEV
jgi:hypothetical protein